jgi:hypothetical protein
VAVAGEIKEVKGRIERQRSLREQKIVEAIMTAIDIVIARNPTQNRDRSLFWHFLNPFCQLKFLQFKV